MKSSNRIQIIFLAILVLFVGILAGCYKSGLPDVKDYLSKDMAFNQTSFLVNLERTNVFTQIFNADYSSEPLTFKLQNFRHFDESPAPELLATRDAKYWDDYFTGREASVAEIEGKRHTEKRPLLDIREHSGEIFFWNTDSTKVKPGIYFFDVEVSNKVGSHLFKNMILNVRLPHPYEPYEFDDSTGLRLAEDEGGILHPSTLSGAVDDLERTLPADSVIVYFHKKSTKKNTVTFKFYDQDSLPISLTKYNMTQWDSLRFNSSTTGDYVFPFAFNRQFSQDSMSVTYDVTNPFPILADVGSDKASISFGYKRISFGRRVNSSIGLTFALFEPGEWEIIFKYKINPKFEDD